MKTNYIILCVSLEWREQTDKNKQANLVFFQFGAWIHGKEEDEKGWDERMHG